MEIKAAELKGTMCSAPELSGLHYRPWRVETNGRKTPSHKRDLPSSTSIPPHNADFFWAKNVCHACATSAVNNSVPPKVNFQFAQGKVTITFWPANCISPLIPYHFILGSLCSLNWGRLYLVVAICLLFSWCLDVQPDCIWEWEG